MYSTPTFKLSYPSIFAQSNKLNVAVPVSSANALFTGNNGTIAAFCVWLDHRDSGDIAAGRSQKDRHRIVADPFWPLQ